MTSTITNSDRIKWAKTALLKALRQKDWGMASMQAEDITKYAELLARGQEDVKTIEYQRPV